MEQLINFFTHESLPDKLSSEDISSIKVLSEGDLFNKQLPISSLKICYLHLYNINSNFPSESLVKNSSTSTKDSLSLKNLKYLLQELSDFNIKKLILCHDSKSILTQEILTYVKDNFSYEIIIVSKDNNLFLNYCPSMLTMNNLNCSAGTSLIRIDINGNVYPCFKMHNKNAIIGNLHLNSLKEILNNKNDSSIMKSINKCRNCNLKNICGDGCRYKSLILGNEVIEPDSYCNNYQNYYSNFMENLMNSSLI